MFNDGQREQGAHQRQSGGLRRRAGRVERTLDHQRQHDARRCHRERKKQVDGASPKKAFQVGQVRRQELLAQVAHTKEQIQLGADAHRPQHHESPGADLIRRVPGDGDDQATDRQNAHLVPQDRAHRFDEALPFRQTCRQRGGARPGDPAGQKRQLMPTPDQQRAGESAVGAGDGGLPCRVGQPRQGGQAEQGRQRQAPAHGAARHAVQQQHDAGAEPPDEHREQRGEREVGHGPLCFVASVLR